MQDQNKPSSEHCIPIDEQRSPSPANRYGLQTVKGGMHVTDLHATLLALLGLNHERLTYRYAGRDFRLTDVAGNVASEIFS